MASQRFDSINSLFKIGGEELGRFLKIFVTKDNVNVIFKIWV